MGGRIVVPCTALLDPRIIVIAMSPRSVKTSGGRDHHSPPISSNRRSAESAGALERSVLRLRDLPAAVDSFPWRIAGNLRVLKQSLHQPAFLKD
jgi:hypothetical protein